MKKQERILCFGDSNTFGMIPSSDEKRYPPDVRWTGLLQKALGDEWAVIEEGLCGRTIGQKDYLNPFHSGADQIIPCVASHKPLSMILIMLGTNDCKDRYHLCPEEIREEMRLLLTSVLQYFERDARPKILLAAPPPIRGDIGEYEYSGLASQRSRGLGEQYELLAADMGIPFLDAGSLGIGLGADALHFTKEDHRRFALAVERKVREAFGRG